MRYCQAIAPSAARIALTVPFTLPMNTCPPPKQKLES